MITVNCAKGLQLLLDRGVDVDVCFLFICFNIFNDLFFFPLPRHQEQMVSLHYYYLFV